MSKTRFDCRQVILKNWTPMTFPKGHRIRISSVLIYLTAFYQDYGHSFQGSIFISIFIVYFTEGAELFYTVQSLMLPMWM